MKTMAEQMAAYAAYHRDFRNKLTHFFGVPLVVFSLFVPMGWFRFAPMPELPLTGATVFFLSVMIYYLRLDWGVALFQAPISLVLLYFADKASLLPFADSLMIFLGTFIGGWIIQFTGHVFEGKRPALMYNALQIFNAPLFLSLEILMFLGFRRELRAKVAA